MQRSIFAVEDHQPSAAHRFVGEVEPDLGIRKGADELVTADGARRRIGRVNDALGHPREDGASVGDREEILWGIQSISSIYSFKENIFVGLTFDLVSNVCLSSHSLNNGLSPVPG